MFATTYDWMLFGIKAEAEAPARSPVKRNREYRRDEEFRSALDRYMADYQKHRGVISGFGSRGIQNTRFT